MKDITTPKADWKTPPNLFGVLEWENFVIRRLGKKGAWELNYKTQPLKLQFENLEDAKNEAEKLHAIISIREGLCGHCWDHLVEISDHIIHSKQSPNIKLIK